MSPQGSVKRALLAGLFAFLGVYAWMIPANVIATIVYMKSQGLDRTAAAEALAGNSNLQIAFRVGLELILLLVVYLFIVKGDRVPFGRASLHLPKGWNGKVRFLEGMLLALVIQAALLGAGAAFGYIQFLPSTFTWMESIGFILLMMVFTALPGFIEEFMYRGYIQTHLTLRKGKVFALVVTSIIFSLSHVGTYPSIPSLSLIFLLSLLLGILYIKSGSLHLSIGLHFAWDWISYLTGQGDSNGIIRITIPSTHGDTMLNWICVLLLVIVTAFYLLRKPNERKPGMPKKAAV